MEGEENEIELMNCVRELGDGSQISNQSLRTWLMISREFIRTFKFLEKGKTIDL
ncbi:hypothetical protein HZC07_02610 [Candidatus Micrarchaeota archaeon]|nr:hypothetical protein [Candidatus Micrarchaeota archaeon]